ncbi:MAG TPA: beta-glucosidase BglX [Cellvibrio sp.]|nr:beta-glucosidase BglX [Cellvibrio sp.]
MFSTATALFSCTKKLPLSLVAVALSLFTACSEKSPSPVTVQPVLQEQAAVSVDDKMNRFIADLIGKMTLDEKLGQLNQLSGEGDVTGPTSNSDYISAIKAGHVGSMLNVFTAKYTNELQHLAVEKTRLGIPLLFGYDVVHGHRTIFPISLGEAASWDLSAIENAARVAAAEASAEGIHWTFAPMVDIARDPRWGRISEGAGEDPYLGSLIAKARIKGFQGDELGATNRVLATAKHFAVYGLAQAGRDYHSTDVSDVELWNTYLPPFKASVDAGVATFMSAFNDLNGVPATGNKYLLTDVLKTQWSFKGFVVGDYTAVNELVPHGFAKDDSQAAELAINAGLDMDMVGQLYLKKIRNLVKEGKVSEARVDDSVRRILEMKYRLGLFEDPYRFSNEQRQAEEIYKPEYLEAARDMARKSIVLLKNANKTLPLSKATKSIAVIGPLADNHRDMLGSWHAAGNWDKPITLLEGIKAKVGEGTAVKYAKGASYEFTATDDSEFAEAIAIAQASDVIVLAMGEAGNMSGEAKSRSSIDLPGTQQALLRELKKLGKPMVLVLMNGRPLTISWEHEHMDAIVETWFAGTMGGHAIADVLFGDYNPSGKLPVTFPRVLGQVPIYYNMKNTGRPYVPGSEYTTHYLDTSNDPLYAFGYGLSYSKFTYSEVSLDKKIMAANGKITVKIKVSNSGEYDGTETVQLYIRDLVGSITRPVKELKGFQQVFLKSGEAKELIFELNAKDLAFYRRDLSFAAEAGDFKVFIGGDSANVKEADFSLAADVKF